MTLDSDAPPHAAPRSPVARSGHGSTSRLLAGLSLVALFLLMLRVTSHAAGPLSNADTWFHLRIGRELWGDWTLAQPGALSSFATSPWVPTQWSTQMLAAGVEDRFGLPGVAWLFGLLYLVFIVVVYALSRSCGAVLPSALATGVVVVAAGGSLSARPQVVSLIFFALAVAAWLRAVDNGRPPWLLVPLTWVWATAHGLWSAGVLLGLAVCLGLLLDRRIRGRSALGFVAVPLASVVAACLTPVGPRLLTSQLAVGERTPLIGEWGPTTFREPTTMVTALFVAAVVVLWSRRRQVAWTPVVLLLLAGAWILTVERMVPFGAVVVAPLFVAAVTGLVDTWRDPPRNVERAVVAGGVLVCLAGLAVAVPHTAEDPAGVPDGFTAQLAALPEGSAVLVEDHTGAWLEWRFSHLNPVVDGMFDAYPVAHLQDYKDFRDLRPGWTDFVDESRASVAVLLHDSPLAAAMESQLGWHVVERDTDWVYLVAPS